MVDPAYNRYKLQLIDFAQSCAMVLEAERKVEYIRGNNARIGNPPGWDDEIVEIRKWLSKWDT